MRGEGDAYASYGDRAQAFINKQIADSLDLLIGAFRPRLGMKTGIGPFGTAEEIDGFAKSEKPVALYFAGTRCPSRRHRGA